MGVLLLIRHGQASFGAPDYDVLSDLGATQGRRLGQTLGAHGAVPVAVLHGSMQRQSATVEAMAAGAGWEVPGEVDPRWDEFDHLGVIAAYAAVPDALSDEDRELLDDGAMGRRAFQEVFEKATARWASGAHDEEYAESWPAFIDRVRDGLAHAARIAGHGELTVVVSSGGAIAASAAMLIEVGADPAQLSVAWHRLNTVLVNGSVTRVVVGSTGARLLTYNEHSYLEPQLLTYR